MVNEALTDEQIELLRSLPKWNGPSVTGAVATDETDKLNALGLLRGEYTDAPLDGDDESRVWRDFAADTLLATIDRIRSEEREVREAAEAVVKDCGLYVNAKEWFHEHEAKESLANLAAAISTNPEPSGGRPEQSEVERQLQGELRPVWMPSEAIKSLIETTIPGSLLHDACAAALSTPSEGGNDA